MSDQATINLNRYQGTTEKSVVATTDDLSGAPRTILAAKTGYTIYILEALLSVTTDNAATQTLQDDAGTPVVYAKSKASPGLGPIHWDFGPDGIPITAGQALKISNSAAGMGAVWAITCYYRPTPGGALTPAQI
jgi:hypothetical protein